MNLPKQNYYEVLKLSPRASMQEIIQAYHLARNAFSKDSLATYSLFSPEEVQDNLKVIEEAYSVLSNAHKKIDYDKSLLSGKPLPDVKIPSPVASSLAVVTEEKLSDNKTAPLVTEEISGNTFRKLREEKGIPIEEVARITKIPMKFILALESEDVPKLPARVYIQGFIRNLASLYRLDPNKTSQAYIKILEKFENKSK